MLLLIGLGNPGAEYRDSRHNLGFLAVDAIADRYGFTPWRSRFQGLTSDGHISGAKVLALKPQTFMNLSGYSAAAAARYFRLEMAQVVVCHDDLDLALGRMRIKNGGSAGGHNGLRSLDACFGSAAYWRLRLGVGRPGVHGQARDYVLGRCSTPERAVVATVIDVLARRFALWEDRGPEVIASLVAADLQAAAVATTSDREDREERTRDGV